MMGLYFLVLLSVGILRPIRNTLALDGLGQTDFYKVYIVSAVVIGFVPLLNTLSDRVPWRRLIPAVSFFFALNLLVLRAFYVDGSTAFGLIFYGWYDLFAAVLVTQLFMVTQFFFHARLARNAYPFVIAGGSLGASVGGAITGFLAGTVGTPNLMLLAAGLIGTFSVMVTVVWSMEGMVPEGGPERKKRPKRDSEGGDGLSLKTIFTNRQVLLIASLVLITIVVKQLVDYQFNTITKEVFVERDAIASFQGKFGAATQWLPILVLMAIRIPLKHWGVGFAVLVLPVAMLLSNVGLLLFWGLWAAVAAKGAETSFRYSAERAAREILYVPVPDEFKLKAKAYIDVAVEKGLGKLISAGLIFILLNWMEYRHVAWAGAALALMWIVLALAVRREYIHSMARAVENRFASLRGIHASLSDDRTVKILQNALAGDDRQVAFALDLMSQAPPEDTRTFAPALGTLANHTNPEIRTRAVQLLVRAPESVDQGILRSAVRDVEPEVREAAVRALHASAAAQGPAHAQATIQQLLDSSSSVERTATLSCLARGDIQVDGLVLPAGLRNGNLEDPEGRAEEALMAAALRPSDASDTVARLMADSHLGVARAAVRSAGLLGYPSLYPLLSAALGHSSTREPARNALVRQGTEVLPLLSRQLLDESFDPKVRSHIPSVMARIPSPDTVEALVRCVAAPETDQILDFRAIKALSKLRAEHPELHFETKAIEGLLDRSLATAVRMAQVRVFLEEMESLTSAGVLLHRAALEAWNERREEILRLLGLLYPPNDVHRCHMALVRGETVPRANALEWLENTVGYGTFQKLLPVLGEAPQGDQHPSPDTLFKELATDQDRWIAHLAVRVARESGASLKEPPSPRGKGTMDQIETVFLLQQVDVLRDARSAHLALLASIAEEVDADTGTVLLNEGDPTEALHVVVRGEISIQGRGGNLTLTDGMAFGTWALIDAVPSMAKVTVTAPTRMIRITQADFHDLLADHPELAIGMLQGLARKVRTLAT
ncbi:MAG: cyclic nucleotide-binding domain-containing protein [Gemmatimonadota bacterium]